MGKIKILHFSTHNEECGIAKYNEQLVAAMDKMPHDQIQNDFFDVSPNTTRFMPAEELQKTVRRLVDQARQYDILHVQHELSFFKQQELEQLLSAMQSTNTKTVVTCHTAPHVQLRSTRLGGLGPRSLIHYLKAKRFNREFIGRYYAPLSKATLILVPNNVTKESIQQVGLQSAQIQVFTHPIPELEFTAKSQKITEELRTSPKDVVYCTVGFISAAKGVGQAIKALNLLPSNYKLAIIGGSHPGAESHGYYDEIADLIVHHKLQDRVYITGYVKEDEQLNALIRECDVCIYPYDTAYYGYVSSASLSNAIANHLPAIAYPTRSFSEVNTQQQVLALCKSPNYYELARQLQEANLAQLARSSQTFARHYSATNKALELSVIYQELLA